MSDVNVVPMIWNIHDVYNVNVTPTLDPLSPSEGISGPLFSGAGPLQGNAYEAYFHYLRFNLASDAMWIDTIDFENVTGITYAGPGGGDTPGEYRTDVTVNGPVYSRILAGPYPGDTSQVEIDYFSALSSEPCFIDPVGCSPGFPTQNDLIAATESTVYLMINVNWTDGVGTTVTDIFRFYISGIPAGDHQFPALSAVW